MIIVYILGTDGAGKTTVAKRLAEELRPLGWSYLYCQVLPCLVWPLKWLAGRLFLRRTNQFKDYDAYREQKRAVSARRRRLTRLYAFAWYVDFLAQTLPRMLWARCTKKKLIVDRFYLDVVVNQGVLQDNDTAGMLRDARLLERILPRATRYVFLDVAEGTAFARKHDIQSVRYLRERKERYRQLAPHYGFIVVDANQPLDAVVAEMRCLLTGTK